MTEHKIVSLTQQGQGRTQDGTYIARVLPGEIVSLEGDVSRIVTPSADRVAPVCRHYKSCGGCAMQHAAEPYVAEWKTDVVRRAMTAQSIDAEILTIQTSPTHSRRRAKFSGQRTKKGALVGFHSRASGTVISVPECQLILPSLRDAIPALEAITIVAASRKSEVALTVTDTGGGLDVLVEDGKELTGELRIELSALANRFGLARLVWEDEPIVTRAPPVQTFGRANVAPPAGAFLQATREGEAALVAVVMQGIEGAKTVLDLFAGCGTLSLPMSEIASVHAVESEAEMLAALDHGWRFASGLKPVTTEARDLYRRPMTPDEITKYDVVVLDPPRSGAEAQVAEIFPADCKRVVMVSCNPATFAREAKTLIGAGFKMGPLQVVDQFRWSAHVELAAVFTPM